MSSPKTISSAFYSDYCEAVEEARIHFNRDEKVTLGFNVKQQDPDVWGDDSDLLYQCVISNESDLTDEADRWNAGILKDIVMHLRNGAVEYSPVDHYRECPEKIQGYFEHNA